MSPAIGPILPVFPPVALLPDPVPRPGENARALRCPADTPDAHPPDQSPGPATTPRVSSNPVNSAPARTALHYHSVSLQGVHASQIIVQSTPEHFQSVNWPAHALPAHTG